MFERSELDQLLASMRQHGVTILEIEGEGSVTLLSLPVASASPVNAAPLSASVPVNSPDIGTFLPRGVDDGLPVITVGDPVSEGAILGYVARGALRAAVIAPTEGKLTSDSPKTGTVIGYGDAVFTLEIMP